MKVFQLFMFIIMAKSLVNDIACYVSNFSEANVFNTVFMDQYC